MITNQDKMSHIYKLTKIEPKYLHNSRCELKELNQPIKTLNLLDDVTPYYTESQLWSILPNKIKCTYDGEEAWLQSYSNREEIKYYYCYCSDGDDYIEDAYWINLTKVDLHTALIDMVLWAIDNKFIKEDIE